jgi:hypothetical protein
MTTRLDRPLKREIELNGVPYTLTLAADGLKIVEKGKRKGTEYRWEQLLSGEVALVAGLRESINATASSETSASDGEPSD